ncbi:hypothetical protein YC2023_022953 [Brassica napus]
MAPPRKSFKVNIPAPAPINNKPEKEEDGFTTPKEVQSRNPPQPKTPQAPSKATSLKANNWRALQATR